MKAEWLGGPNDGQVINMRDGTHEICTANLLPLFSDYSANDTEVAESPIEIITYPIVRWRYRYFILYDEGKSNEGR